MQNIFTIRKFRCDDKDYQNIAHLESLVFPNRPVTGDELQYQDKHRDKKYLQQKLVLEKGTQFAGYCQFGERSWSYVEGGYYFHIIVHPDFRNMGGGTLLFDRFLHELNDRNIIKLSTFSREDQKDGIRFAKKRNFKEMMRFPDSELDVQSFEFQPFSMLIKKIEEEGIEIINLNDVENRIPDWKRTLYKTDCEINDDIPSVDPPTHPKYEQWEKEVFEPKRFNPNTYLLAIKNEKIVGMTCIKHMLADPKKMATSITGIVRSHRRKGLATLLKALCIEKAKQLGIKTIITDNEENNPMYTLNLKLGFKPLPAWIQFDKEL